MSAFSGLDRACSQALSADGGGKYVPNLEKQSDTASCVHKCLRQAVMGFMLIGCMMAALAAI